jgi:peptide/nickel transport system permease protein
MTWPLVVDSTEAAGEFQPSTSLASQLVRDRAARLGLVIVVAFFLAALIGPYIAPHSPTDVHPQEALRGPGSPFWLGTDDLGRDVLSRLLYGARLTIFVGLSVILLAGSVGIMLGLIAGYLRGFVDGVLMRLMDVVFAFPIMLLALAVVAVLGNGTFDLILAMSVVFVAPFARVTRSATLAVGAQSYMEGARAVGVPALRILRRHILPNIQAVIVVQATVSFAFVTLVEASLSFLGLGFQPPAASWGGMLAENQDYLATGPWASVFPGLCIMVLVLGFNLLGDGLRDVLDPRLMTAE